MKTFNTLLTAFIQQHDLFNPLIPTNNNQYINLLYQR